MSSSKAFLIALLLSWQATAVVGNCSRQRNQNQCNRASGCSWTGKTCIAVPAPTPAPVPKPTPAPVPAPIAAPIPEPTPSPVPASLPACTTYNGGQCPTERCVRNGGSCLEPSGGSPPAPAPAPVTPCSSRNGNSCENGDGLCIRVKNECQAVDGGTGTQNDVCQAMLTTDSDGDYIYVEIPGKGCAAGFTCDVAKSASANLTEVPLDGNCEAEGCIGKKVPGNCNGNNANSPHCEAKTERVTICHRTCSATNPWVRITIDEDAWDGQGCGHQQHDIRNECANKAPWTEWGVNRKDYLIKRHGTRDEVAARLGNKAAEKAYWKNWERACPFVRNGACCDWNDPENPCCGDPPVSPTAAPVPKPTPAPVPAPTPAPVPAALEVCPIEMGAQSGTACPDDNVEIVSVLDIKSPQGRIIPEGYDISSIFYQMEFIGTSLAPQVKFKIDSPFDFDTDMYVQFHTSVGSKGGLDPDCEARWDEPGCNPDSSLIQAGCVRPLDDHVPYAVVSLFFVSENSMFGSGAAGDVTPYECCPLPNEDKNKPIIEYTFKILCACPPSNLIPIKAVVPHSQVEAPTPAPQAPTPPGRVERTSGLVNRKLLRFSAEV